MFFILPLIGTIVIAGIVGYASERSGFTHNGALKHFLSFLAAIKVFKDAAQITQYAQILRLQAQGDLEMADCFLQLTFIAERISILKLKQGVVWPKLNSAFYSL